MIRRLIFIWLQSIVFLLLVGVFALINGLAKEYDYSSVQPVFAYDVISEQAFGNKENSENEGEIPQGSVEFYIDLPLFEADYYEGKYENAVAAMTEFKYNVDFIKPGDEIGLYRYQLLTMSPTFGYVDTDSGWGSGTCWFVTTMGGLIDQANVQWKEQYGYELFIIHESHPHPIFFKSYPVNNGYGYNIQSLSDGTRKDYIFSVSELAQNDVDVLWFEFSSTESDPNAYLGQSVSGKLVIMLKD